MAQRKSIVDDIQFEVVEVGEMSEEDANAVADFIAKLAYKNIKRKLAEKKDNNSTRDSKKKE